MKSKRLQKKDVLLVAAFILLVMAVWLISKNGRIERTEDYEQKLSAARLMERCSDAIRGYKKQRDIPFSPLDWQKTGLIGEEWNTITTTLGAIEAKRTSASSDMAALAVQLLQEAGVQRGDTVAVGLSGSFPGMNLAVLCACAELQINVRCIASVGASTHGANNPALTFPDMLALLINDGLLPSSPLLVTLGGDADCGIGMDTELREEIATRLTGMGLKLWREPDFEANLKKRSIFYESGGKISCYIGVGGNVTSIGRSEVVKRQGVILPTEQFGTPSYQSGLLELYHARGIPVINLLNIKQLTADYALPYDPTYPPLPGTTAIYYRTAYSWQPAVLALALAVVLLILYRKRGATQWHRGVRGK